MPLKNGWRLISAAPRAQPSRSSGSFTNSLSIKFMASLLLPSPCLAAAGNFTWLLDAILRKVASLLPPLNGVVPYIISNMNTPNAHQSTPLPCPFPATSSGARYSWVPTQHLENASVGSATNSLTTLSSAAAFFVLCDLKHPRTGLVGTGRLSSTGTTSALKHKSKSDNMMWPSSRSKTFSGFRSR